MCENALLQITFNEIVSNERRTGRWRMSPDFFFGRLSTVSI